MKFIPTDGFHLLDPEDYILRADGRMYRIQPIWHEMEGYRYTLEYDDEVKPLFFTGFHAFGEAELFDGDLVRKGTTILEVRWCTELGQWGLFEGNQFRGNLYSSTSLGLHRVGTIYRPPCSSSIPQKKEDASKDSNPPSTSPGSNGSSNA
jgi:hypothetical protein